MLAQKYDAIYRGEILPTPGVKHCHLPGQNLITCGYIL